MSTGGWPPGGRPPCWWRVWRGHEPCGRWSAATQEELTGRENLELVGRLYHLSKAYARSRAAELLEQFDLVDAADRPAKGFSGGMQRRLDLAASLVGHPNVLFLDEPTTGLDPESAHRKHTRH